MPSLPAAVTDRLVDPDSDPALERSRLRFAAGLAVMGVLHFVVPGPFRRIVPRWFPWRSGAVLWSGVAELTSGVLVAIPRTQRVGGWMAAGTILAVYPANVQMAVDAARGDSTGAKVATLARLPLQLPMIATALRIAR